MKSYRPPIAPKTYALLVHMAAEMEIRPSELLDRMIREAWLHRDENVISSDNRPGNLPDLPHAIKRPNLADCPEELDRIKQLYGKASISQIAREVNRPKTTVADAIKRLGL